MILEIRQNYEILNTERFSMDKHREFKVNNSDQIKYLIEEQYQEII